ncbi:MAG: Sb-PDE family phosphodiesterase, partial [Pseudomonadales bacterium]|nr:Sb-PDE family phosphodiesterase [Pseudomonadales bacterium]
LKSLLHRLLKLTLITDRCPTSVWKQTMAVFISLFLPLAFSIYAFILLSEFKNTSRTAMKKLVNFTTAILTLFASNIVFSHGVIPVSEPADKDRLIQFPDTKKYKTIVLDPHTHSTFSDGEVWPTIRIGEALKDGLDAIAITEHLEWQPHLADIPHPDRNRAYNIALKANGKNDLIVIPGSEITRNAPASHINALFISDANKLIRNFEPKDPSDTRAYYNAASKWPPQEVVNAANEQGAFLFWNHAWWGQDFPNGIPIVPEFHISNAKNKLIHGIEIANGGSYSEEAFQIGLDLGLTLMGVSDVHGLIDWDYSPDEGGHRPVTLVLAKSRSQASVREALFDGRTVVWFKNLLVGHREHMDELLSASLDVTNASYSGKSKVLSMEIKNVSDVNFQLKNKTDYTFIGDADILEIKQHETSEIRVKTGTRRKRIDLQFEVLNALVKPKQHAEVYLGSKIRVLN